MKKKFYMIIGIFFLLFFWNIANADEWQDKCDNSLVCNTLWACNAERAYYEESNKEYKRSECYQYEESKWKYNQCDKDVSFCAS